MSSQQLIEYLQAIILLETAIQKYKTSISRLELRIESLAIPVTIPIPVAAAFKKKNFESILLFKVLDEVGLLVLLACVAIPTFLLKYIANLETSIVSIALYVSLICLILLSIINISQMIIIKRENENNFKIYNKSIQQHDEEYHQALETDKQRVLAEQDIASFLSEIIKHQEECIVQLNRQLAKLYGLNVIYPDFRGLIIVSYMYKYLDSGITNKLEGPEGAYAQYLQDERTNRIIHKIDKVIDTLDTIMKNQKTQIAILDDMNESLNGIDAELSTNNINIDALYSNIVSLDNNVRNIESGVNQFYQKYSSIHYQ